MTTKPSFFCAAPWTHTYLSPQGERRLCCASREQPQFTQQYLDANDAASTSTFSPLNLEKYWNSEFIRRIRVEMLAGNIPDECVVCKTQELSLDTYRTYFTDVLYPQLSEEIVSSTNKDGFTTMNPRSFDYRISNKCNFKCRMCGDQLSSSWEEENKNKVVGVNSVDQWKRPDISKKIKKFQENVAQPEFEYALLNGNIDEIYWVGGEPLTWDFHWTMMKKAVKGGFAHDIFCRYNTNLFTLKNGTSHLYDDLLKNFKGCLVAASIDATNDIGEYIRTGLRWHSWEANFIELNSKLKEELNQTMYIDLTITLPGLFGLKDLVDFSNTQQVKIIPKLIYAFDPSIALSPLALPRNLLNPILDDLIKYVFLNLSKYNKSVLDFLKSLKKRATHQEKYPERYQEGLRKGKEFLLDLERKRESTLCLSDIYASNPDVLQWWESEL